MSNRLFWPILILTALAGLALRICVGAQTFVSFDEWQHLFMAGSARGSDLSFELAANAHPPLFFLLLGGILKLGQPALYRSISIAAGAGSIVLVGWIARRLFTSTAIQLACAFAFALSADAIAESVEIRSYQLAVLLSLAAFLSWLSIFDSENATRHRVAFAVCGSLAVLSHYSTVFFLGACIVAALPSLRRKFSLPALIALAIPCAVFVIAYILHAGNLPPQGYLFDFYWKYKPHEHLLHFLARNLRNFFNLFSPIEVDSAALALLLIGLLAALAIYMLRKRHAVMPIVFAATIVAELMAGGITATYPFGGLLRHDYIAGPFLLIAAFAIADALLPPLYIAIPAVLAAASIANAVVRTPQLIVYPGEVIGQEQYAALRQSFPHTSAIYADHWSVIGYFIHTSTQPRTFVQRVPDAAVIDEYSLSSGTHLFYDKTRRLVDLTDPAVYQSFADCLRASHVPELTVFLFAPNDKPFVWAHSDLPATIAQLAAANNLTVNKLVTGETWILASFGFQK